MLEQERCLFIGTKKKYNGGRGVGVQRTRMRCAKRTEILLVSNSCSEAAISDA